MSHTHYTCACINLSIFLFRLRSILFYGDTIIALCCYCMCATNYVRLISAHELGYTWICFLMQPFVKKSAWRHAALLNRARIHSFVLRLGHVHATRWLTMTNSINTAPSPWSAASQDTQASSSELGSSPQSFLWVCCSLLIEINTSVRSDTTQPLLT